MALLMKGVGFDLGSQYEELKKSKKKEAIAEALGVIKKLWEEAEKSDYIGEAISQAQHGLQCAKFAKDSGASDEVAIAALFHDIGHLCKPNALRMSNVGVAEHERLGAEFVARLGFSERVCDLIRGHVKAKRYLTFKNPHYLEKLSPASKKTLSYQGGPMTPEEAELFEMDEMYHDILKLRSWDEKAKIPNYVVPQIDFYLPIIEKHLYQQSGL